MKNKLARKKIQSIRNAIIGALAFGFVLPFLVNQGQYLYYQNIYDGYTVETPVTVEAKEVKPCEDIKVNVTTVSTYQGNADFSFIMICSNEIDVQTKKTLRIIKDGTINRGESTIPVSLTIPCDTKEGIYYVEGTVNYFPFQAVVKTDILRTEMFQVTKE